MLFGIWQVLIPCGILAIVSGVLGMKAINKGMAIAGVVTGNIGVLISVLIIFCLLQLGKRLDELNKNNHRYRNYHYYNYY